MKFATPSTVRQVLDHARLRASLPNCFVVPHKTPLTRQPMPAAGIQPMGATRTIWLFTRGCDSVRLEGQSATDGTRLLIAGPGAKREVHDFRDLPAMLEYQRTYEQLLRQLGYSLEPYITDRRRRPR